jgi:hypothetical protein
MSVVLPNYPDDFFDFGRGLDVSNEEINQMIKEVVEELVNDENSWSVSRSTGNTQVMVTKDLEMNGIIVEVYKNYQRKSIQL